MSRTVPRFQLRHSMGAMEIPPGEIIIGRSQSCDLVIDHPMVSRRHASLRATSSALVVEDLSSRNGVEINGTACTGVNELRDGDTLTIGDRAFQVRIIETGARASTDVTIVGSARRPERATVDASMPVIAGLGTRGELIEKALAVGRVEDAEHILRQFLDSVKGQPRTAPLDPAMVSAVVRYALRLASDTGKAEWIDCVFDWYRDASVIIPATAVDEVHPVARRIHYVPSPAMREYIAWIHGRSSQLSPAERFALQRLEGLLRVLTA
jgi:hypothetical protein